MKLRQKIYLSAVLPLALVAIIGVVLLGIDRAPAGAQGGDAGIAPAAFELSAATEDYLRTRSEAARTQWRHKHDAFAAALAQAVARMPGDDTLLADLRTTHAQALATFQNLSANSDKRRDLEARLAQVEYDQAAGVRKAAFGGMLPDAATDIESLKRDADGLRQLDNRLAGELVTLSRALTSDAFRLADARQAGFADHRTLTVFGLILLIGFGITLTSLMIGRSVVRPIARLTHGAQAVAGGDLDHRLGLTATDEIGELARSFDGMLDALRQTMASRDELNRANAQLKNSAAALIQSEKMAGIGQMVAGVAHEINTPLAYVRSNVELVKDQLDEMKRLIEAYEALRASLTDGGDEQALTEKFNRASELAAQFHAADTLEESKDLLARGLNGLDQIRELVVSLRNFSRLDRERVTGFSLHDGLDSVLVMAKPALKTRVKVVKEYGEVPSLACSPSQINQVFMNVILNAAQAIDGDRGIIIIQTSVAEGNVRVVIRDNGRGIAPEVLPKVFEPFFTTKKVGEGTGLGLSISRKIIEEHGGDIALQSAVGKGCAVTITLPAEGAVELRKSA